MAKQQKWFQFDAKCTLFAGRKVCENVIAQNRGTSQAFAIGNELVSSICGGRAQSYNEVSTIDLPSRVTPRLNS